MQRTTDLDQSDICVCGRLSIKIHCPTCGFYTVYAMSSKSERKLDPDTGAMRIVPTFRCRRCSAIFDDDEWRTNCRAPYIKRVRPMRSPADDTNKIKDPETLLQIPEEIMKKWGAHLASPENNNNNNKDK